MWRRDGERRFLGCVICVFGDVVGEGRNRSWFWLCCPPKTKSVQDSHMLRECLMLEVDVDRGVCRGVSHWHSTLCVRVGPVVEERE